MDSSPYESLPTEILEKIFLDVPPEDISFRDPWVCRRWSDIVQKPNYWRKRTKKSNIIISSEQWTVLQNYDDKIVSEKCLRQLCILDYNEKPGNRYFPSCVRICDISHSDFEYNPIMTQEKMSDKSKRESEDIINTRFELDINTAAAHILFGDTMPIKIFSTGYLYSAQSLSLLLQLLRSRKTCSENQLETLKDDFSWWNFKPTFNNLDDSNGGFKSLEIQRFKGCLHNMYDISQNVTHLYIAIDIDDRNKAIDPGFSSITSWYYTILRDFQLQIKAGTNISSLGNLPDFVPSITLLFSLVAPSQTNWVVMAAERLEPMSSRGCRQAYSTLVFIDCSLITQQMEEMLRGIRDAGIEITDQITATGLNLEEAEDDELSDLVFQLWPNIHGGYIRLDSKYDFQGGEYSW